MMSRSPSPRRVALSSKDSNIRQQSSKSSTPQLSPLKDDLKYNQIPTRSKSPSLKQSPKRVQQVESKSQENISSFFKNKPIPELGFTIFSDDKDYSTELQLASNLKVTVHDENDISYNKENVHFNPVIRNKTNSKRKVLEDLSIQEFPGAIKYPKLGEVTEEIQLTTVWTNDQRIIIPSYVTPPRINRMKYVSFEGEKVKPKKRSNSQSDVDVRKVVKKLVFDIHKD